MKHQTLTLVIRAAATFMAFAVLLSVYDAGSIGQQLSRIGLRPFLVAIGTLSVCMAGMALKWRLALRDAHYAVLLRAIVSSSFYSILPSGQLGGEISKVLLIKARQPEVANVTGSVIFDKITGLLGLVLIGLLALAFASKTHIWQWLVVIGIAAACVTVLLGCVALATVLHHVRAMRPGTKRAVEWLSEIALRLAHFAKDRKLIIRSLAMGALTQGCVVLIYVILATALNISARPADLVCAVVLANLASLIPISLAGLGVREAGLTVLLSQYPGASPEQALALSLGGMAVLLVAALAGAAVEVRSLVASVRLRGPKPRH